MRHTRKALPWIVAVLALAFVATVVVGDEEAQKPANKDWQKVALTPADVPQEERNRENPYAWNADARAKGKLYFSSQCVMCHGEDGKGSGDLVERLELKTIPDFTDSAFQQKWTDGAMYYVIQTGHGAMPGQKNRFDPEIKWGMVNYVRSFAKSD